MSSGRFSISSCRRILLLACCLCSPALAGDEAARALVQADSGLGTPALVGAILGYTAWPGSSRTLTLCVSRGAAEAGAILAQLEGLKLRWPMQGRSIEADTPPPGGCDAVYFEGWDAQAQRQALHGLAGRPVLSIGRGAEFCSDGGLFCLAPGAGGLRFEVNLDAVSRSGLRVHPQVLRLARPRAAGVS